jgi:hypothetical protein
LGQALTARQSDSHTNASFRTESQCFLTRAGLKSGSWVRVESGYANSSGTMRSTALDPLPTFKIGPVNGREARESGLRLKARLRHDRLFA